MVRVSSAARRTHKALVKRNAALKKGIMAERERLYKVSLSLIAASWVAFFLLSSLLSQGSGTGNVTADVPPQMPDVTNQSVLLETSPGSAAELGESLATSDQHVDQHLRILPPPANLPLVPSADIKTDAPPANAENLTGPGLIVAKPLEGQDAPRNSRLSNLPSLGLDEFRTKAIAAKARALPVQKGAVIHRVEPNGKEYNYASASKGAKALTFNKEAKGASNILDKDKDKYLRNPCSADGKFVVIELSEETLVDAIEIANFEHYSSNFKDFELQSSLVYPTESWEKLGNFTASNVKHAQRFSLPEPKWARYLKINLLNHYGSEFYCTVSSFEVYGVDAVEKMLEELQEQAQAHPLQEAVEVPEPPQELTNYMDSETEDDDLKDSSGKNGHAGGIIPEARTLQVGRIPGDTILKMLMQKVHSLDVSFSALEQYLEELNGRYGKIFKELDNDLDSKDLLLEKIKSELKNLESNKQKLADELGGLLLWKELISAQFDRLSEDNNLLRNEVQRVKERQDHADNKGLTVIFMAFLFSFVALTKLVTGTMFSVFRPNGSQEQDARGSTALGWTLLLLCCSVMASVMVL